jgi:hypothetical protein
VAAVAPATIEVTNIGAGRRKASDDDIEDARAFVMVRRETPQSG